MSVEIRWELERFAKHIEETLRLNDQKGGWVNCPLSYLLRKLGEETGELAGACCSGNNAEQQREMMMNEAADVAAIAMMIYDNARERRF